MGPGHVFDDNFDESDKGWRVITRKHLRETQQDAAYLTDHLVAVADGLGGHSNGAKAANTTINVLAEIITEPSTPETLKTAFEQAQIAVAALGTPDGYRNPGSTLVAVVADKDGQHLHGAWIGDSRIYAVSHDGVLTQLTEDHADPLSGGLLGALGEHGGLWAYGEFTLNRKDVAMIICCSDGFHGPLEYHDHIYNGEPAPFNSLDDFGNLADLAGETGSDNITVAAVIPSIWGL